MIIPGGFVAFLAGPEALGNRTWGWPGGEAPVGASEEPVCGRFPTDQPGSRDSDASVGVDLSLLLAPLLVMMGDDWGDDGDDWAGER